MQESLPLHKQPHTATGELPLYTAAALPAAAATATHGKHTTCCYLCPVNMPSTQTISIRRSQLQLQLLLQP